MAEEKTPKIVDEVNSLQDKLSEFNRGINQVHQEAYAKGIETLFKEKKIKRRKHDLGYDLSALDEDPEAVDMFINAINNHADDWMRHLYKDFDEWDDVRKEDHKIKSLGMNKYSIGDAVKKHGSDYSIEQHLDDHKQTIGYVNQVRQGAHFGVIEAKHSKDLFKHAFGIEEGSKHWKKIKWDILEQDDQYIKGAVGEYLQKGKLNDKYLKNAIWYKSS